MQEKRGWIAPIDGLRAIAVLSVLFHHANNGKGFPDIALANVGVVIFFCISGFLAYYVLHRDEQRLGHIDYNYFLYRRILRIWPAALVVIAFVWITNPPKTGWISLFTFSANWQMAASRSLPPFQLTHLWTIAVEEQFYVLAPGMYLLLRSRWRWVFCGAVFAITNLIRVWYIASSSGHSTGGLYYTSYAYADTFLMGAMIAFWYLSQKEKVSASSQRAAFGLSVVVLGFILWAWASTVFPPYGALTPYVYAALPLGTGLLLFSALPFNGQPFDVFLASRPMVWIGRLSYALYLVHLPVLSGLAFPSQSPIAYNVFFLVFTFATAFCLRLLVEKPALLLKDRVAPTAGRIKLPAALTLSLMIGGIILFLIGR